MFRLWSFPALFIALGSASVAADNVAPVATPSPAASASAATDASPIQIDACRLDYNVGGGFGLFGALVKTTGQLKIKFTNEGAKEASVVRFRVVMDANTLSVRDVGKFSPNVTVDHGFRDMAGSTSFVFSRQPQPHCRVTFIRFGDGSTWGLPDDPDPTQPPGTAVLVTPEPSAPPSALPAPAALATPTAAST